VRQSTGRELIMMLVLVGVVAVVVLIAARLVGPLH